MRFIDYAFNDPAANLACDEALLDAAEEGRCGESLRLWESATPFVVLGVSQKVAEEVHEAACLEDGIPILRRCSAGGCVLQGPGCLNYSLVLSLEQRPEIATIHRAYREVSRRLAAAFAAHGVALEYEGTSDLALAGRKVSGNAQKRRRRSILYHGTLLYRDKALEMERCLREPADRPAYRGERNHGLFVTPLPLTQDRIRLAVQAAFSPGLVPSSLSAPEHEAVARLVREKYSTETWNRRR